MENEKTIKACVEDELNRELEQIKDLELGSDQMLKAASTIETLHKVRMSEKNSDDALTAKNEELKLEAKKARNAMIVSLVGTGATIGLAAYRGELARWVLNLGLEFEKTDIWRSKTVGEFYKGLFNMVFKDR